MISKFPELNKDICEDLLLFCNVGFLTCDSNGTVISTNSWILDDITKENLNDFINSNINDFIRLKRINLNKFSSIVLNNSLKSEYVIIKSLQGIEYKASVSNRILETNSNIKIIIYLKDITKITLNINPLHSPVLLNEMLENLPYGIFIKNVEDDFRIIVWNKYMCENYKIPKSTILNKTTTELPDKFPNPYSGISVDKYVVNSGSKHVLNNVKQTLSDNTTIYFNLTKFAVYNHSNEAKLLVGVFENITEQYQESLYLVKSEACFKTFSSQTKEANIILNKNGIIIAMNLAAEILLDYESHELENSSFFDKFIPDEKKSKSLLKQFKDWAETANEFLKNDLSVRLTANNHKIINTLISFEPTFIVGVKHYLATLAVATFIETQAPPTKQITVEKENQTIDLRVLKFLFYKNLTLQIKNPLTMLHGTLDLIKLASKTLEEEENYKIINYLSQTYQSVNQLNEIVDLMFKVGLDDESLQNQMQTIDIHLLCVEAIAKIALKSTSNLIPKCISEGENKYFEGDYTLLSYVMQNLIDNAIKFTHNDKEPEVNINFGEKHVYITVMDYGIGIPENEKDKIYLPFYKCSNAKNYPGNGLGLVLTKEFLKYHNGSVLFSSKMNEGTVFTIQLPIKEHGKNTDH